jgi:hypothetical protein
LGIVYCVLNGCVNFSRRFYSEVLVNPATASPLLFPETVANSPASHISALWGKTSPNYTLIGDHTTFVQGLGIGIDWLRQGQVDGCLVIGAEELDWLVTGGASLFERDRCAAEGAGAVYLSLSDERSGPRIESLVEPFHRRPSAGADELFQTLGTAETELITQNQPMPSPITRRSRQIHSLAPLLGDAFTASAAWQMVLALEMMTQGTEPHCTIPVIGSNNLLAGLRLTRGQL